MCSRQLSAWRIRLISPLIRRVRTTVAVILYPSQIEGLLALEESEFVVRDIYNASFNFQNASNSILVPCFRSGL